MINNFDEALLMLPTREVLQTGRRLCAFHLTTVCCRLFFTR